MSLQCLEEARIEQLKHNLLLPWFDSRQDSFKPGINWKLEVKVMASVIQELTAGEYVRALVPETIPIVTKKAKTDLITPFLLLRQQ